MIVRQLSMSAENMKTCCTVLCTISSLDQQEAKLEFIAMPHILSHYLYHTSVMPHILSRYLYRSIAMPHILSRYLYRTIVIPHLLCRYLYCSVVIPTPSFSLSLSLYRHASHSITLSLSY